MKGLTKKKLLIQSNLQKIIYNINNDRFIFNDDEIETRFDDEIEYLVILLIINI